MNQAWARHKDSDLANEKSHFHRFLQIYRAFPEERWPTRQVAVNPTTTHYLNQNRVVRKAAAPNLRGLKLTSEAFAMEEKPPRVVNDITHPQTLGWAHLLNVRYRMLLMNLAHAYRFSGALSHGDELTARGLLINWTFGEMYNIRSLSSFLVQLPLTLPEDERRAGPPFEMPYTTDLPDSDTDRWRSHRDLIEASRLQILELEKDATPQQKAYLAALRQLDESALAQIQRVISGC